METMSLSEFHALKNPASQTGLTDWIRRLPFNTPTALPFYFRTSRTSRTVHGMAAQIKVKVQTRTFKGQLYVNKVETRGF